MQSFRSKTYFKAKLVFDYNFLELDSNFLELDSKFLKLDFNFLELDLSFSKSYSKTLGVPLELLVRAKPSPR
jgi:hypothetical protein